VRRHARAELTHLVFVAVDNGAFAQEARHLGYVPTPSIEPQLLVQICLLAQLPLLFRVEERHNLTVVFLRVSLRLSSALPGELKCGVAVEGLGVLVCIRSQQQQHDTEIASIAGAY
jgi:hypothetical protein